MQTAVGPALGTMLRAGHRGYGQVGDGRSAISIRVKVLVGKVVPVRAVAEAIISLRQHNGMAFG